MEGSVLKFRMCVSSMQNLCEDLFLKFQKCSNKITGHVLQISMRSSFRTRSILGCITWWLRPRIQDDFDHWRGWQPWWMCDGVEASYWSASSDAGFWLAAYWHGDGHILRFDRWEVSLFITENIYHLWKQHMRNKVCQSKWLFLVHLILWFDLSLS